MSLISFSQSNDYYFEMIPNELGYFAKRAFVNKKLESIYENSIVYLSDDKLLYVITNEKEDKWFLYEKAIFLYNCFDLNDKYVLIIENDDYYYGYIDGFPCVFVRDFETAKNLMLEYSNNEFVKIAGIGHVSKNCHLQKKYEEIFNDQEIDHPIQINYLNEESDIYYSKDHDFNDLFFSLYEKNSIKEKKTIIKFSFFLSISLIFLIFSINL